MIHKFSFIEKILLKFNVIPHPIVDALSTVVTGRALQVSVKMGIIDAIGQTPKSAAMVAEQTGVSEHGALVLLDCLDALGYVKKQVEGYRLTPRGNKFLSKDSPSGFQRMLLFSDYLFNILTELESTVKSGKSDHINYESFTPEYWDIFTNAMREFSQTNAAEVANLIPLPPNAKKLLDLGGSHGLYSTELCKRSPLLLAEIIDFALVEPFAKMTIEQHRMTDRIKFRIGDFIQDELGRDYDVILAFNVIHGLCSMANQNLAAKVNKALNAGGIYVILDQIKGMEGKSQLSRVIAASIGLIFHHLGGSTYAFEDVRDWLQKAGFHRCELRNTRAPGFALIIGEK